MRILSYLLPLLTIAATVLGGGVVRAQTAVALCESDKVFERLPNLNFSQP
jgi:hypothetical protein